MAEIVSGSHSYEVLEKRAAIVKRIFEEAAAGIGSYSITRRLNEQKAQPIARSKGWQTSYVSKILDRPSGR